ncbi:MAG: putative aminotransferase [Gemmatimonadetes bacterium]|nr:putative aminotransferase [Gemmatimonadota bacterium]
MIAPRPELLATPLAYHGGRHALGDHVRLVKHDFSVCLNAYGPCDAVRDAAVRARLDEYPDPECLAPRRAAAERWTRPIDEIAFGAGAAELIFAVCFAYLRAGDTLLIAGPAFGEYERAARLCGARVITVLGAATTFRAEVEHLRPRLAFLCSPNNPSGACVALDALAALADSCTRCDTLLVLDQSYDAFAERPTGTPALRAHPSVLHLRSLTKEHAIAGVRAAFAVGPAGVIAAIEHARVPWLASSAAQGAAVATMTDAANGHAERTVALLRSSAASLADDCRRIGYDARRSETHFFLIRVGDAARAREVLLRTSGILVRDCTSFGLPDSVRVAARTPEENDVLLAALGAADLAPFRTLAATTFSPTKHD